MKTCCIIAEFNPFHNGHKYIINKAKKIIDFDNLIIIMSGNYVQRGECAIYDKISRANIAISHGADIVIELPPYYAINNANLFAKYSCAMINKIPIIDYLIFGSEIDDYNTIKKLSNLSTSYSNNTNNPYVSERSKFFSRELGVDENSFNKSNLILAIEYLKYLPNFVKPIPIKRIGCDYNEDIIKNISSASALRNIIRTTGSYKLPDSNIVYKVEDSHSMANYFNIIINEYLLTDSKNHLDNRIKSALYKSNNYEDLINLSYAKNISRSTIKRTLLRKIFHLDNIKTNDVYFNILALNEKGKSLLKFIPNPILRTKDIKKCDSTIQKIFNLHNNIDNIYNKLK